VPSNCDYNPGKGVWFTYTPCLSGEVIVRTCGSDYQTVLSIYANSCGPLLGPLRCGVQNNALCGDSSGRIASFSGTVGMTYRILVTGYDWRSGNLRIVANGPTCPVGPVITGVVPNSVMGANSGMLMTINGSGFVSGCAVTWRDKTFGDTYPGKTPATFSPTQLTISAVFGNDPSSWTAQVIDPDGQASSEFPFSVQAPLPVITSLSPASATAGGPGFTLSVNGGTFHRGSVVRWNGSDRSTTPVLAAGLSAKRVSVVFFPAVRYESV